MGINPELRILVYLVLYDSGQVSLEHLLLSWYPSVYLQLAAALVFRVQGLGLGRGD